MALVRSILAALLLLAMSGSFARAERLKVVASFSILADFVANVGGERIDLATLVGPDGDAHVYAPTPADAQRVAAARLLFVNGLGFEGWIGRLVKAADSQAAVVEAAKGAAVLKGSGGPGHGVDPHAWQDIANAKIYVANIRTALREADPAGGALYEANAAAYIAKLDALEREVRETVARIPAERRRVITSHEAFGYLEKAYGIDIIAPQGVSTDSEASAKDVARIIQQIRKEKIPAVFVENISDPRLIRRIAEETGATIGERLYSDALSGPHGPAATYIDMMRHNIRAFAAALAR